MGRNTNVFDGNLIVGGRINDGFVCLPRQNLLRVLRLAIYGTSIRFLTLRNQLNLIGNRPFKMKAA